jgi:hypothetical protein
MATPRMRKRLQTTATPSEASTRERARQNVTFRCVAADRDQATMANMENPPAKRALATLDNPPTADVNYRLDSILG